MITPDVSESTPVREPPERVATPSDTSNEDAEEVEYENDKAPVYKLPLAALFGLQAP